MRLPYERPNEKLERELRQVAQAAGSFVLTLRQINNQLPEGFPKEALVELCGALMGLPEGTAENSRTELEFARVFLPRIRRRFFVEADEETALDEDAAPPLQRDGALDQRMKDLSAAVGTALEEYREQAQEQPADVVEAEERLAVDGDTTTALSHSATTVAEGAERVVETLDKERISEIALGDVLRRRIKDAQNLARTAIAQLLAPVVDRVWLDRLQRALRPSPGRIRRAAEAVKTGVAVSRPYLKWYLTVKHSALDVLADTIDSFCDATAEATRIWEQHEGKPSPTTAVLPPWAVDGGRDEYGEWLAFEFNGVRQRLRWIPPGRFLMGSPVEEPGRMSNEGPQHEVTIGEGFWLFATPVTQALYAAVMGEDPIGFEGADHPAGTRDKRTAQGFLTQLNALIPGLNLVLPSEAQWEFACRAGTTTATYVGTLDGEHDEKGVSTLAEVAWFFGAAVPTRPVGLKFPNAWGLHDMLGNVWEWCADEWRLDYSGAPADGSAWTSGTRAGEYGGVARGGSVANGPLSCRAARRLRLRPPVEPIRFVGFRPARD